MRSRMGEVGGCWWGGSSDSHPEASATPSFSCCCADVRTYLSQSSQVVDVEWSKSASTQANKRQASQLALAISQPLTLLPHLLCG